MLQTRRPWAVVVAFALLVGLAARPALHLRLVTDFADLLPQNQPSVVELRNILARTRGLSSLYVVLEGRGTLEVEGKQVELREGHAVFVPAGAEHRFVGYEQLSVLVLFEKWKP